MNENNQELEKNNQNEEKKIQSNENVIENGNGEELNKNSQEINKDEAESDYETIEVETLCEEEIPEEEYNLLVKENEEKAKNENLNEIPEVSKTRTVIKSIQKKVKIQKKKEVDPVPLYIKTKIDEEIDRYSEDKWKEEYIDKLTEYGNDPSKIKIFIWCEEDHLSFSDEPPKLDENSYDTDFFYCVKIPNTDGDYQLNKNHLDMCLSTGIIKPNYLKGLLHSMNNYFIPTFMRDTSWPENVKKEFIANLYRFMAILTEYAYQQEGLTELYIPNEDLSDFEMAQQDKDLIRRLETTLIHWYRQIKDVVNNQDTPDSENAGPLTEIAYWRQRKINLSNIDQQLERPELHKIKNIVNLVDRSYVKNFEDLTKNIKSGSIEAEDNLNFLQSLSEPCKKLQEATPREIPALLPDLLNRVRMIWEKSNYYNTQERILGLLHKISNEIIKRCKKTINVKDMLDGDVEKCIQDLQDSIECGLQWKKISEKTAYLIKKKNKAKEWDFNLNSIFAQGEAFVQRCVELKEICEGQLQFARKGSDSQIPQFGGSHGPEIVNILEEIKLSFRKNVEKIRGSDQEKILDVKSSKWHDEFNLFKIGLKDLDNMYTNIINFAFESVTTVQQGVEMLEAFDYLAKRENIMSAVKKKAQVVLLFFVKELDNTKFEYDRLLKNELKISFSQGKYSGQALWVRSFIHRIEKMKIWIDKLKFIDDNLKKNAFEQYDSLYTTFKQNITNQKIKEWKEENKDLQDVPLGPKLDKPVLLKITEVDKDHVPRFEILKSVKGYLESNFDNQLWKLMKEVSGWKKLVPFGIFIPNYADDFSLMHKENLRVLSEYVMLVVRDTNKIYDSMDEDEKKLFKTHLDNTEKVISSGLSRLKWSSKGILKDFVRDCRKSCKELMNKINSHKNNTKKIFDKCHEISSKILIKLDKKRVYEVKHFEDEQERHTKDVQMKLRNILEDIRKILCDTYEIFLFQPGIQEIWFKYVQNIDMKIEEALKKAIKISLLELYKVIREDDNRNQTTPIFKLSVELQDSNYRDQEDGKLFGFKPNPEYLLSMVQKTITGINQILGDFKRMDLLLFEEGKRRYEEEILNQEKEAKQAGPGHHVNIKKDFRADFLEKYQREIGGHLNKEKFHEKIAKDRDVEKCSSEILKNLKKSLNKLNEQLNPWKRYESYWSDGNNMPAKERYIKESYLDSGNDSYGSLKTTLDQFELVQSEIQQNKSSENCGCIELDNTGLKAKLVGNMGNLINTFLSLLQERACKNLKEMHHLFQSSAVNLEAYPLDLHSLKKSQDLWKQLNDGKGDYEQKLDPLEDKFKLLEEFSVNLRDDDILKKNTLREAFQEFSDMLVRIEKRNKQVHSDLYYETMKNLENFGKDASESKHSFIITAPFSASGIANDKAFSMLIDYRDITKQLRKREDNMKFGVDLFGIKYLQNIDLKFIESEIQNLEDVWTLKENWDKKYEDMIQYKFKGANTEDLEDEADEFIYQINQYTKEIKKWDLVSTFKLSIEQFKQTLPLIKMLNEPYMRGRHWEKLQKHLGPIIDPHSETFTLKEVFKLNLIQYQDAVREVCEIAREEYKIESSLQKIKEKWDVFELEMDPHKNTFKVKKPDEIFNVLEDHMATLSSQKTTLFYESFKDKIENWEGTLQKVLETLDCLLMVQRQWVYLESIFAQQNDQDKQLIGDISKFQNVNSKLATHMSRLNKDRNIKRALCYDDFLIDLQDMSKKLDESQKILFQLLERKRKEFPRFYFLSNDDLFELLGNSKDPYRVNKHIKKCFEGIKSLKIISVQTNQNRSKMETFEVAELRSPDQEEIKLTSNVPCDLGIESWLKQVERMMKDTLRKKLNDCLRDIDHKKKEAKWFEKWVRENPGQMLITASQIYTTDESVKALEKGDKAKAWKPLRDDKKNFIDEMTKLVRKPNTETERLKLVALITIEVHSRDVIEILSKVCTSINNFEWLKQLRFYKVTTNNDGIDCEVKQTNTVAQYGFEYQGNNGRLVITALTDRCYITLTTAILLKKGGAPQGPAGTGKTETVKDLGKAMAKFVLVFNCSEGLDYKSLGRMFSGLVQTGSWGCFDEFNRIEIEVLSVVAQQVHSILNALSEYHPDKYTAFPFEGEVIQINPQIAIFITMNPGYAGRSELPDNLKSLFRPISMMVPESSIICEIMLQSEGFKFGRALSLKLVTLYNLMTQQLSKQDHYDFGLRAIKSVLTCAGITRRERGVDMTKDKSLDPDAHDEQIQETKILMQAIRDMNLPKFVAEDVPLFNALFNDLFTNIDLADMENSNLQNAIEEEIKKANLQLHPIIMSKIMQLYDSKNTRHGNMLVGGSLSGKSTTWKILQKAMNSLNKENPTKFPFVKVEILNPKAVTILELFGSVDQNTMEWNEGVLSSMMSRLCKDDSNDQKWMVLDGPVDTLWIESMNTVLDDNKVLTLLNGDRISLPPQVGLVFEVEDLSVASPATVSRAGMIYLDINDLGWESYAQSWIENFKDINIKEFLNELFEKWFPKVLKTKRNLCKELVPVSENACVISFCKLLDCFQKNDSAISFDVQNKTEIYYSLVEKWFTFAMIWSIGATVNEEGRMLFDYQMRDIESMFPHANLVYDYYINNEKNEWGLWEERLSANWKPGNNLPYHKMFVPTTDTIRNKTIIQILLKFKIHQLVIGITGTGKTALLNGVLQDLDDSYNSTTIIFSAQTSSGKAQEIIESKLIKRTKNKMVPDGKKGVFFIDDLNMPRKDLFGSQPPLELLRQWMDYEGWFDKNVRELFKYILNVQFLAAMGPPGGGRMEISKRVLSKFSILAFTFPNDDQVKRIFQSILTHKFLEFDAEEIKPLSEPISVATLNLFKAIQEIFLPTPAKSHYLFNLRDMSKVIQGMYQIKRFYVDTKLNIYRLWVHECLRVFHDRLVSEEDRVALKKLVSDQLELVLSTNMRECTNEEEQETVFVDFMGEKDVYMEISYAERGNLKILVEEKLKDYNEKSKSSAMNIVLFQEAVSYICKIERIIKLGKGHGILVGEGGSGRHSLTRLAAYLADYRSWQIEVNKNYRLKEFREDVKRWSEEAGVKNRPGVFIFSDNEIINESFVEDINNILTVGEIPNLFSYKEDFPNLKDKLKKDYYKENQLERDVKILDEDLWEFFFSRIQQNFHLMICMSKTSDNLRNYIRMYPGLVNNTTMVWFMSWPKEALVEVANKYLEDLNFESTIQKNIATFFGIAHTSVLDFSFKMLKKLKRLYYVTPTNYIELVKGYNDLLKEKQSEIGGEINKLALGLQKLDEAAESSEELAIQLDKIRVELSKKSKDCEDLVIKIESDSINANEKQKDVEKQTVKLDHDKKEIQILTSEAQADLEKAEPILKEAEAGLANLKKEKIAEIKSFNNPPKEVNVVLSAVMTILGRSTDWASAKKELADPNFLQKLTKYDKDNMSKKIIDRLEKFTQRPDMSIGQIRTVSEAAGSLWDWVLAMEQYAKSFRDIEPKRRRVNQLRDKLNSSEEELNKLQENFIKLKETIIKLNTDLEKSKNDMQKYQEDTNMLQIKLERADKLLLGFKSTKIGWTERKKVLEQQYEYLVGDSLISAAFLSYAGPFPLEYRDELLNDVLLHKVRQFKIPHSKNFKFSEFLVKPTEFLKWSFQGLPNDKFSQDNAVLVTKGRRYPLMIDPQMQANSWIKTMEKDRVKDKMLILDPQTENYMTLIERSISSGNIVVFQNLDEELDPSIEPILNKSIKKIAGKLMLYLGEKEVLYNPNFRFYMTTKLANPRYKAEVSTRVTLVNFMVKENGLEEQLTSEVIRRMEFNLEKTRIELVNKNAENERKLKQVDDNILRMLQETKGSLIDDETLIKELQNSKEIEDDAKRQIENSANAMKKTIAARESYKPLAQIASKLFFIVNEFAQLDHMYQFSLESYILLFGSNITKYIEKNPALGDSLQDRLTAIAEKHKKEVFIYACRGLFEKDKILLAIQMAVNLSVEIDPDYEFFLRGAPVDKKSQSHNPNPDWISDQAWDMISSLEKRPNFTGIVGAFVHNSKEWKRWYMSGTPETEALPGEWETKCDNLRKMIILKAIRPDRVIFSANSFVSEKIGEFYISPLQNSLEKIADDSTKLSPIIFILAPGVDPFPQLEQLAKQREKPLQPVSLGQGQSKKAKEKVYEGTKNGYWLYLANCHLSLSFLKELEKIIENLEMNKSEVNDNFRLFLSSNPHPKFPISILQKSIRVTTEPPKGLKSNMTRLYSNMPEDKFQKISEKVKYKKLLFSLCWFHSIIIERKKFKSLGWNIGYDFNDSDWSTADRILKMYLDQNYEKVEGKSAQWDAIKYLISEVTYGGRVTDEWDRRLLNVYSNQFFNEKVLSEEKFKLADNNLPYVIPDETPSKDQPKGAIDKSGAKPSFYESKIKEFPNIDVPEAFGQHINAEISSQIADTNLLINSIISLQPRIFVEGEESRESVVLKIIKDLLEQMPSEIDLVEVAQKINPQDQNPLKIVLMQEIARYNKLLEKVTSSLVKLQNGINGFVVISEDLELIMENLFENKVPITWKFCYHSLKPLQSWIQDLVKRIDQLYNWAYKGQPNTFWISGFSFPTGFTTALLQQSARRLNISIDSFTWDFAFLPMETTVSSTPKEGAYLNGLFLEGAKWEYDKNYLIDAEAMKLFHPMPIIHFKPVIAEGKSKSKKAMNFYVCPTYMYPIRTGVRERPSFMFSVNLPCKPNPSGIVDGDFWVKRGVALLMSLLD